MESSGRVRLEAGFSGSTDPKVYGSMIGATNYKGITTTAQFESSGELKNPAMTLYPYKGDKKIALNQQVF